MSHLENRLFERETARSRRIVEDIYGAATWIDDLDIVNELGGHSGCVNALSWSKSGRLLASGSDDTHLNIHTYQPDSSTNPFSLTATISTGHTANVFSVKFMPHSNDRTLVSCAGDSEVRVFDIEYSSATSAGNGTLSNLYDGTRYLHAGNTNARVYRSHSNRAKRIVTESSPHLFLSCSEDGEVRQWDLRQPSSAYPAPRGGRGYASRRSGHDVSNVPPPLISYKRYGIDLNTISCSASQPHYIVLGGAHLHCFLHDRRMLGRDLRQESGRPSRSAGSDTEDEVMATATRCVLRFAPGGQTRMKRAENWHVTACKISDARPNEMVGSWSARHIYSFDLVSSPDAVESEQIATATSGNPKKRKRKGNNEASSTSGHGPRRGGFDPRTSSPGNTDVSLRVRYENGQSEDISISRSIDETPLVDPLHQAVEDSAQQNGHEPDSDHMILTDDAREVPVEEALGPPADQEDDTRHRTVDADDPEIVDGWGIDSDDGDDDFDEDTDEDEDADETDLVYSSLLRRSSGRMNVETGVPCASHIRQYEGHCNVQTVKDVNFFGLEDEYVVSGSDDGNLFIWDRKTTKLLNILKGDGDVVNVVQGMS